MCPYVCAQSPWVRDADVHELLEGELGASRTPHASPLSPTHYDSDVDDASLLDDNDVSWLVRSSRP